MDMTPAEYRQYVKGMEKKSPLVKNAALAFLVGGAICALGQLIRNGWSAAGLGEEAAGTAASCTLVFLSALLTGLGLYSRLARFGGAGTLVPITGFANAVVSPAMDFRSEGLVTGMGGPDVRHRRAGDRFRHPGICDLRRAPDALRRGIEQT